jgi:hypothetical protein
MPIRPIEAVSVYIFIKKRHFWNTKSKAADLSSLQQVRQALQGGVCQVEPVRLVSRAMAIFFFVSHGQTFRLSALFDIKKGKRLARPT